MINKHDPIIQTLKEFRNLITLDERVSVDIRKKLITHINIMSKVQTKNLKLFTKEGEKYFQDILSNINQVDYQIILLSSGDYVRPLILNGRGNGAPLNIGGEDKYIQAKDVKKLVEQLG